MAMGRLIERSFLGFVCSECGGGRVWRWGTAVGLFLRGSH